MGVTNPIKKAQKLQKELVDFDKRLSKGEEIDESKITSVLSQFKQSSRECLMLANSNPLWRVMGNQSHHRMENVIKKIEADLANPELFEIKNGIIKRVF